MSSFWINFDGHKAGCVEADDWQNAKIIAEKETGFSVTTVEPLPYPAEPRINKVEHPKWGVCPSFCFKPEQCKGNTSCPQRYSCTE